MPDIFGDMTVGCKCHYLDSGSFSLWGLADKYAEDTGLDRWEFYNTGAFWDYVDNYAAFVIKNKAAIDYYSNMDVIPNAKLTWRNQQYLEKEWNLNPVPVVHYKTDLKWLERYIGRGYDPIALGGLVGSTTQDACKAWIDRAFQIVCDRPDNLPRVRIHGFGITSYRLLLRYPWWSVDSSSWTKIGAFGGVLVPHRRHGKFVFTEPPYVMKFSDATPDKKLPGRHFDTLTRMEKEVLLDWLETIGVPMGETDRDGTIMKYGVTNRHSERKAANLFFFEAMRKAIPRYPWPFRSKRVKGFGLIK